MINKMHREIFYSRLTELYNWRGIDNLLGWDQQVCMPEKGADDRAAQQELVARTIHNRMTQSEFVEAVNALWNEQDGLNDDDKINVRETKRSLDKMLKLPEEFVAEFSKVSSLSYVEWTKARPANDFKRVKPHLEKIVELAQRRAEYIGYEQHPYDALLDSYEPYGKLSVIKPLLLDLAQRLAKVIPVISQRMSSVQEPNGDFPEANQAEFCAKVAQDLCYDFKAGRLDKTHHPFESSIGLFDVRITTRYDRTNYLSSLFTVLHEVGHALYEQGFNPNHRGMPLGEAVGLGIHESQSRLWENIVGRSREFSEYIHGVIGEFFPSEYSRTNPETIWNQTNKVIPSLIRVEADEVTYSLHVVIRMLLEERLIQKTLSVADLPEAWNELYQKYLGITPDQDRNGVLQDVHWYSGSIGYFPTYALGNLYGALIMEGARKALPNLSSQIKVGNFAPLRQWLRTHVHEQGMRYPGPELVKRISGKELTVDPFVSYIQEKFNLH